MTENEPATPAEQLAAGMAAMADAMVTIIEAVAGHRAQLEAAGFSPTAAEAGAIAYHAALMQVMARGQQ